MFVMQTATTEPEESGGAQARRALGDLLGQALNLVVPASREIDDTVFHAGSPKQMAGLVNVPDKGTVAPSSAPPFGGSVTDTPSSQSADDEQPHKYFVKTE